MVLPAAAFVVVPAQVWMNKKAAKAAFFMVHRGFQGLAEQFSTDACSQRRGRRAPEAGFDA